MVALLTVLTAFLLPGVALYCTATLSAIGDIGQVLHARERRRVDARLELALHEHGVPDVDDEAGAAQHQH